MVPLSTIFNPVGGYGRYIVPAAFVPIVQQLLLVGASPLTVVAWHSLPGALSQAFSVAASRFYGFSTLGQPLQLFALAALFALATSFMGQAVGAWCAGRRLHLSIRFRDRRHREPRNPDPDFPRHQHTATLPDGFLLAARDDHQVGAPGTRNTKPSRNL